MSFLTCVRLDLTVPNILFFNQHQHHIPPPLLPQIIFEVMHNSKQNFSIPLNPSRKHNYEPPFHHEMSLPPKEITLFVKYSISKCAHYWNEFRYLILI